MCRFRKLQFEYLKMPFGVANALVAFQKFIGLIFKPLINSGKILLYLDDIFIATSSISENLDILKEILKICSIVVKGLRNIELTVHNVARVEVPSGLPRKIFFFFYLFIRIFTINSR